MEKFQHVVQMHFSTACGAVAVAQGLFEVFGELVLRDFGRKGNLRLDEAGEFGLVDFSGDVLLREGDDGIATEVRLVGEGDVLDGARLVDDHPHRHGITSWAGFPRPCR